MFKKNTKTALLMSVLALMLSISMFVGSTFAWFTDSVSSVNNIIKSGNLDIEVEYTLDGENWAALDANNPIFSADDLWEPGHTVVGALRVKNVGSLAAKLDVVTTVFEELTSVNVYDETFKLSDYLKVYTGADASAVDFDDRDACLASLTESAFGASLFKSLETDVLEAGQSQDVVIAITMPTTVGNEANHKTGYEAPQITFGIYVNAAQQMFEEDSFGNDYDKDATFGDHPQAIVTVNGPQTVVSESLGFGGLVGPRGNLDLDASYTFKAPAGETKYDDWYADYEVSITGADPAVLDADGNFPESAVIMSGQYDANEPEWQSFYTPAVPQDTPIMLLRGAAGLKLDYATIRDWIGTFNCGVKKNTEAASGATIQVALVIYKEDANGNIIDKKIVCKTNYTFE